MIKLRLLFAFLGAMGCLLAAVGLEAIFTATRLGERLDDMASPVLIMRSELRRRLEEAGGESGEVQISLSWNNTNDLDLSCISPLGEKVAFDRKRVPSGGALDVDCNNGPPLTERAVENIRWPYGRAPAGKYKVFVTLFAPHPNPFRDFRMVDATPFRVNVMVHGRSHEVTGTIRHADHDLLVYEFEMRNGQFGWDGVLPGMLQALLLTGVWTAVVATLLTLALTLGQLHFYRRYYNESLFDQNEALRLIGWGALSGLCAGVAGQLVFSLMALYATRISAANGRLVAWVVLGLVLARMLSRRMPNLPVRSALVAGAVAGIWASLLLQRSLIESTGTEGRIEAATLLGLLIGLMIVLMIPEEDEEDREDAVDLRMTLTAHRLRVSRSKAAGTLRRKRRR